MGVKRIFLFLKWRISFSLPLIKHKKTRESPISETNGWSSGAFTKETDDTVKKGYCSFLKSPTIHPSIFVLKAGIFVSKATSLSWRAPLDIQPKRLAGSLIQRIRLVSGLMGAVVVPLVFPHWDNKLKSKIVGWFLKYATVWRGAQPDAYPLQWQEMWKGYDKDVMWGDQKLLDVTSVSPNRGLIFQIGRSTNIVANSETSFVLKHLKISAKCKYVKNFEISKITWDFFRCVEF